MKSAADIRSSSQGPSFGLADVREVEAEAGGTIRVDDAALLFRGHYVRAGADLIISDETHRLVVHDYFEVGRRPKLVAPDGASLSDAVIDALSLPLGGERYAQAGAPQASDASAAIGRVQTVTGSASVVRNGVTVALHVGDLVYKGDVVQTERGSSLAVSFLDGTLFSLSASARMLLNEMVYKAEGESNSALFSLVQGSITFVAGKVAKTGDMKIGTPVATMGIRGTAVHVQIDADNGTTRLSVMTEPDGHTGRFEVYDRDDPTRLLFTVSDPGNAFIVSPNGPLQVKFEQVAKTPADLQFEAGLVQAIFKAIAEAPRLPVFQGPSTGGGGGSSTEPNIVQPDTAPPGAPNGPVETPPVDPLSGSAPRGSSQPPVDPLTAPLPPGGSPQDDPLVLTPRTFTVVQGNALVAATVGQGVLGATTAHIVAARAGIEAPMEGLSGGTVTLQGRYGTLLLRDDGTYVYRADKAAGLAEGQQGADVFTYRVEDKTGVSATTTLTMDVTGVNDAPVAPLAIVLAAGAEDASRIVSAADLLAGASDVDGDALRVSGLRVVSGGGTIEDLGDGRFIYRPAADASGRVTLAYAITDGHGGGVEQIASFEVSPVNDAPVVARALSLRSSPEDTLRPISPLDLLAGATDADGDALAVTALRIVSGDGTIEDLGNGHYAYRPDSNASGPVTLAYTITDGHGGSVAQTARFDVIPVNDAPTIGGPLVLAASLEDTARVITAAELLAGAGDVDGDVLALTGLKIVGGGGTIEDLGDGRYAYRPAANANGPVTLAYTITDGHGGDVAQTARFQIAPVNDAPVIRPDATSAAARVDEVAYGAPGSGTLLHSRSGTIAFSDPDFGDVHGATVVADGTGYLGTLTLGAIDEASGTLAWNFAVPDGAIDALSAGETRVQTYSVRISDSLGGSTTQVVSVTLAGAGERPPVAADDLDLHPSLLVNSGFGAAPDFSGWTQSTVNSGNFINNSYRPQIVVDRSGTYLAGADAVAVLAFEGTIDTRGGTAWGPSIRSATFSASAGDAIKFDWQLSSGEDHARGRGYLRDASNGQIVATVLQEDSIVSGSTGWQTKTFVLPSGGTYYIEFQVGSYDSTFGQVVGAELVIDYAGVVPRIREDMPLVIQPAELLANDSDPSGLPIHLVSVAGTSAHGAAVTLNPDGTITYDPRAAFDHLAQGETATDSFVYTIANSTGATASATAFFTVSGDNDAPIGGQDHIVAAPDASLTVPISALLFNDRDPDSGARLGVVSVTDAQFAPSGDAIRYQGTGDGGHFSYVVQDEHGTPAVQAVEAVVTRGEARHLVGTAAAEILIASATTEVLTGGAGRDVFVFADAGTARTITDFAAGASGDAIDLTGVFGGNVTYENLAAFARLVTEGDHAALEVSDGSGGDWHILAHLTSLPASATDVTLIWTDHLVRLNAQAPLV
ncbi:cadherin-like domain-containing protein [Methylobacterium durans]|uniref:Tandem-95 repeat protein n=1 Tax=Methylobacterium durans TaxID=2202825 RepID=A0A2U8W1V0_9HYPH|nr:cadherin-like domain-containing protein [Methylobacterium durans]AWN40063.1 hypothetical protein DK389_05280 [Methylobacterium durans]